jgi:UDP-GlcNAc3NAcA epimerase
VKNFLTVVGARPQFVKASVVSRVLRSRPGVTEMLVHTGQHYDHGMSDVFFRELAIPKPDVNLGVGSDSQGAQTARMLEGLERLMVEGRPDWVLVYGDTNSTLAGSLAASKLGIPVAHVEAGLRSFNRVMPEEINRVVTDHLSCLLFAPTDAAVENLSREGIAGCRVLMVGDVMYDAALFYSRHAAKGESPALNLGIEPKAYVLATIHRAENTDDAGRLAAVFGGLARLAAEVPVVVPLHPRTRKALSALPGGMVATQALSLIEPVGYLDMLLLEKNARLIVTDSGGVQKEAFFHGVPCVTLRGETEWVELVQSGWNELVFPVSAEHVHQGAHRALARAVPIERPQFYGRGRAAEEIADALLNRTLERSGRTV